MIRGENFQKHHHHVMNILGTKNSYLFDLCKHYKFTYGNRKPMWCKSTFKFKNIIFLKKIKLGPPFVVRWFLMVPPKDGLAP
jgi:hypothetical protein